MALQTKYERCMSRARRGHGAVTDDEVKRVANHLFARELVGGYTIGRENGKTVIHRPATPKPKLP